MSAKDHLDWFILNNLYWVQLACEVYAPIAFAFLSR